MDPIESINYKKDSTLAMLWAAQDRGWSLHYMRKGNIFMRQGQAFADCQLLQVQRKPEQWFTLTSPKQQALSELDVILMRVDPPYDTEYLYTTHLLESAARQGSLVVNQPQSLRLVSEKLSISLFPEFTIDTLVTQQSNRIKSFLAEHGDIIVKPLDGMGGTGIFRIQQGDKNTGVILETITELNQRTVMAQKYIPDITQGDKRILMINGEPIPYALARIPTNNENRGNLAAGGHAEGRELSARDHEICAAVGPWLRKTGVLFAGLDVIGDYLTEINVTSPTCIRELDKIYHLNIADQLLDTIETKLT